MKRHRLMAYIEEHQERLFELLQGMIAIPTENDGISGSETPLAEHMQQLFSQLDIESELYCPGDCPQAVNHPDYHPGRNLDGRCNIPTQGEDVLNFVFLLKFKTYEDLPEDTSLRRALKQLYVNGKFLYEYGGVFPV